MTPWISPKRGKSLSPSLQAAKLEFQKRMYTTSYGSNFGRHIADTGDVTILKFKKISEMPVGSVLNAQALECLDKWVSKGESKFYMSKVMSLLRNIFTLVRTQKPVRNHSRDVHKRFQAFQLLDTNRFDLIARTTTSNTLKKVNSQPEIHTLDPKVDQ